MFFKNNKGSKLSLSLLACMSAETTLAASQPASSPIHLKEAFSRFSPYVVTLSAGPVWTSSGETQTFYLQPMTQKTYAADSNSTVLADGELFLGVQRPINAKLDGQLGLAVATTSNANLSGNIWDDALPQFNNFNYAYNVQHTHIAVKGKLIQDMGHACKPYVSGSLGVGFNQARHFTSIPTLFEATPTPNFQSNTTTALTYTVGIGVQRAINQHWQAGMGYEFADWGQSQLARAAGQTMGQGLSLNHLYTNGLQFSLSYLS